MQASILQLGRFYMPLSIGWPAVGREEQVLYQGSPAAFRAGQPLVKQSGRPSCPSNGPRVRDGSMAMEPSRQGTGPVVRRSRRGWAARKLGREPQDPRPRRLRRPCFFCLDSVFVCLIWDGKWALVDQGTGMVEQGRSPARNKESGRVQNLRNELKHRKRIVQSIRK